MTDMVRVNVNTGIEAYPVLGIGEWRRYHNAKRELTVPAEMFARLTDAQEAVERAEVDIMQYLAERHEYSDIRRWVADYLADEVRP